jgi:hypothetical protein
MLGLGVGRFEILLLLALLTVLIAIRIIRKNRRPAEKPRDPDDDQAWRSGRCTAPAGVR